MVRSRTEIEKDAYNWYKVPIICKRRNHWRSHGGSFRVTPSLLPEPKFVEQTFSIKLVAKKNDPGIQLVIAVHEMLV